MKKVRIGKDITFTWTITTNGESSPLTGRNLTLFIIDPHKKKMERQFTIDGNTITFKFKGTEQKTLGDYSLELWENLNLEGQTVCDNLNAFTLVSSTNNEQ